jgi:polyisoprenoid-binding protein YceI
MKSFTLTVAIAASLGIALPAIAQSPLPGAQDAARVEVGSYQLDPYHTMVTWTVNHMGVTPLSGAIAAGGGTLEIDPADPSTAKVEVTFNVADMTTTVPDFTKHLLSAEIFEADKNPTATFTSTSVKADGMKAKITGDLTIKGVAKSVTLDAEFFGAGTNPMTNTLDIGFSATGQFNRSDLGLGYGAPNVVSDTVDLQISAAFTKAQ